MHRQSVRRSIFRLDRPVHRLDVAAGDPQADPEIARRASRSSRRGARNNTGRRCGRAVPRAPPGLGRRRVRWAKEPSRVRWTRISLPGGENETALSIRFSRTVSIISSVPSTKRPGKRSAVSRQVVTGKNDRHVATGKDRRIGSGPACRRPARDRPAPVARRSGRPSPHRGCVPRRRARPAGRASVRRTPIARWARWLSSGRTRRNGSSDWRMTAIGVLKAWALSSAVRRMSAAERCKASTMRSNSAATSASSGRPSRPANDPASGPCSRIRRARSANRRSPPCTLSNVPKVITAIAR